MTKQRIVHIEDSKGWREMLRKMFQQGFDPSRTEFESREDCDILREEIAGHKPLASSYILDNEIGWDYGGKLASEIHDSAKQQGKSVIVISLLCSSMDSVRKEFGKDLAERNIPVLDKLEHAPVCGFYIARCLNKGPVPFQEYLQEQGITLLTEGEYTNRTAIQDGMLLAIAGGKPGLLYQTPQELITAKREEITKYMRPESIRLMDKMFLPLTPGGEKRR